MRRYADVLVHRLLAGYVYNDLDAEVNWLNHRSSVVRSIQDLYVKWKSIRWLRQLPGPHEIWVTGVSNAGILWFMPSLSLNGFLHISELKPAQYWKFDGEMLIGTKLGTTLSLGLKLLADVNYIDDATSTISLGLRE
jgi:exoribonuclease R